MGDSSEKSGGEVTPGRRPVERSAGSTESERYLQRLCERTFLKFWSHPCVFQNDGLAKRGEGKELCDLLVVFGNDILIFSDKHCEFPNIDDLHVAWGRWFKRAVQAGVNQIYGAERWIRNFPERLFLDRKCTKAFPVAIPGPDSARFHRIVVAHGASSACRAYFGSGSGSLMLDYTLLGDAHLEHAFPPNYFKVGRFDDAKGFVHVFDDTSLEVVMRTTDTVADFVGYLRKKECFVSSRDAVMAAGEEELSHII